MIKPVELPDYYEQLGRRQAINLALYRCFAEREIEFAYPTQSVFIENQESVQKERLIHA